MYYTMYYCIMVFLTYFIIIYHITTICYIYLYSLYSWLKEGAVVIDVGINSVPDASTKKGIKPTLLYGVLLGFLIYLLGFI